MNFSTDTSSMGIQKSREGISTIRSTELGARYLQIYSLNACNVDVDNLIGQVVKSQCQLFINLSSFQQENLSVKDRPSVLRMDQRSN